MSQYRFTDNVPIVFYSTTCRHVPPRVALVSRKRFRAKSPQQLENLRTDTPGGEKHVTASLGAAKSAPSEGRSKAPSMRKWVRDFQYGMEAGVGINMTIACGRVVPASTSPLPFDICLFKQTLELHTLSTTSGAHSTLAGGRKTFFSFTCIYFRSFSSLLITWTRRP